MAGGSVRHRHAAECPARRKDSTARCRCAGTWAFRYYAPDGRRREKSGYPTRRAAEAALREVLAQVDRGTWREVTRIGFAEFAERWLETYAAPNVKPSTLAGYRGAVRNHLAPYFGDAPLTAITREAIERFLADKLAAVHPLGHRRAGQRVWSAKTVHNAFVPLREMLEHAVEWGYLVVNPAARVRPVKRETPEREVLSAEELGAVLAVAEEPWRLIFRVAGLTGLRRGELLGLRWADLELDRARLHVRQTFGRYGFGSPKSKASRRVVPLTPGLVAELRRHKLAAPPNEHDLVFASGAGTPLDPDNLGRAWERVLRKAGLRRVPFHSLRHTAVSLLIAHEGLNPKQLQAMIGHASIQLTYDTYGHLMPDAFDGFGAGLDALAAPARPRLLAQQVAPEAQ